jgi:methionyl-tRNA formyltransferase
MFCQVLDGLHRNELVPVPQNGDGFRCFPRIPADGLINWSDSAVSIHRLIRALTRPYSGAYTFYLDKSGRLQKLMIWEASVVQDCSSDIGVPGQVIKNDKVTGESWILTGKGIIALKACAHENDGVVFNPGRQWQSIRMRLGVSVADELYKIYQKVSAIE